jgi:hypothetical protein
MRDFHKIPALAASMVIVGFLTYLFFPALFNGKILAPLDITTHLLAPWSSEKSSLKPHNHNPSDAVTQYLPYRIFAEKSFKEDGYIGWNPYEMGGVSLAGNTMALPDSFPTQLHRFLKFKDAWNLGIYAEFLIAGFGMLIFLRSRKLPWLACVIGAVAYMANSQFIIWIYHRWALGSFCWMPWVLWSSTDLLTWKNLTVRHLLLPAFLALAFLGGSLQHTVFVFLACGCVFVGNIKSFRTLIESKTSIAIWTLAFLFATGITAFSIYPQITAYLDNTAIGHGRGGIGYKNGPLQPILSTLFIPLQIWPWLVGDPQTLDGFKLIKGGYMDLAYLGTIPMLLALGGLFQKTMPAQAKWLIIVGLMIPLTPLVGPLYHRVQLLFLLGGAWMAAEMTASLMKNPPQALIRGVAIATTLVGFALLGGTLLPRNLRETIENKVVTQSIAAAKASQFGSDKEWIESRAREWTQRFSFIHPRSAWIYGLLLVGTTGLVLTTTSSDKSRKWGPILILTATSLELLTLFQTWTTYSNPSDVTPTHSSIDEIRTEIGPHRILQTAENLAFANIFATPNLLSAYLIPSVDAYESIQYQSSLRALENVPADIRLSLAGVALAVHPTNHAPALGTENWSILSNKSGFTLRMNPSTPAPISAGNGSLPNATDEILTALRSSQAVTPTQQTMNHWSFAPPQGSQWIRISQNWHKGWQWRSGNQGPWQNLLCGSDSACWIPAIPTDSNQIEVRFFPRPYWSTFTSVTILLTWLVALASTINRNYQMRNDG